MATLFQENIYITNTSPHVDAKYGPYSSLEEAWEFIGPDGDDIACIGLTVGIQPTPADPVVEYWFKDACEDVSDLVLKEPDMSRFVEDANYVHTDNNFTTAEKTKLADLENYDDTQIVSSLDSKVDKVAGKQLSTEDYTTADMEKLRNMQPGGQENVIETIRVNDQPLTPDEYKAVDITVPTNTSDLTNDSGFIDNTVNDLVNYYDKTEIDSKVASVYKYKGSVQTYADLPSTGQVVGDVYNIATADATHHIKAGDNVAWNGTTWDVLAGEIDLTDYYTSSEVDSLLDEKISEPANDGTNGQVLTTDGNGGRSWTSIPAGVESLDDLSDVSVTTPTEGQILKYDATNDEWINANPDTISLDLEDLNNVSTTTPTDGQILKYDATNDEWVNDDLDISVSDLGDLGDVDIDSTSIADGQIIKYNATTGKWENANVDVSTSNLEDLGDVNVTTPTEGDIITYDATNSEWVNVPNTNVGQIIQVEELPTAGENELGNIYQYVGTTTSDYVNGYFYKCLSTGTGIYTRYYWLNIAVNTETITDVDEVPKKATYYNNIEPIKNTIYRTPSDVSRKVIFSENRSYLNLLDLGFVYDSSQDVYTTTEEIYFRKLGTEDQFSIFVEDVGEYKLCDYFSYRYNNRCHHTIKYKGTTLVDKDELGTFTVYEFIKACELYIGDRKGQIVNKLTNLSPTSVLSTQCEILPIPKANIEGLVIQYIGETDENYTNGYFYKCVSDGEDPATYSWENIQVQEGTSGSQTLSGLDDVTITNPTNNQILKYDAVNEVWVNSTGGAGQTIQVEELPTASSTEEGNIYQYVGETDEDYTNGYFYKCVETETAGEYTWLNVNVDDAPKIFYGTTGEWDALSIEEKITYDYAAFNNDVPGGSGGSGTDSSIWHGTIAEWEALPVAEKISYQYAAFTDDAPSGGSGGGTWGSITGNITDQTDLINYIGSIVGDIESALSGI